MSQKIVMTPEDITRTLARIAHEIIEQNKPLEHLILVGIRTRGVPLAKRIAGFVEDFVGLKVPVGALDPSPYRDDLPSLNPQPVAPRTDIPVSIEGKSVVLVERRRLRLRTCPQY